MESLANSVKSLMFGDDAGGAKEATPEIEDLFDPLACTSCSDPCDEHPWVTPSMMRKLDLGETDMRNTCAPRKRAFFVCTGPLSAKDWPKKPGKAEDSESPYDDVMRRFGTRCKKAEAALYLCEMESASEDQFDVLVFPDHIRIGLNDLEGLLDGSEVASEPLAHRFYVFVCAHVKRDKRCAVLGNQLLNAFEEEVSARKVEDLVAVSAMSHVGGHAYAGNVLLYPHGVLYGRGRVCHVVPILESLTTGKILKEIHRGNQIE